MNPARRTTAGLSTAVVLATAGGLLTALTTPASAATTCTSPVFKRQFYANTTFSGTPERTDCDGTIDQNWGTGAPATGLPKNDFGVRWTVTRDFGSGGPFALGAAAQDGIRVYVDGVRKVNLWKNVSTTARTKVNVNIPAGKHTLRVDFVNRTGTANVKFAYAPRTSATVDTVRPLAPAGAAVTYTPATNKAKLTWSKNKEMDLAGYRVYRRLKGSSTWTRLTTTTATSYTDTTLPMTGQVFYYEVRAYDKAGNTSSGTADQGVTTVDRTAPEPVTGLTALGTTAGNSVSWRAPAAKDVDHYEVWSAPEGQSDPDGPEIRFGTSFTDSVAEPGTPHWYAVQALDSAGNISPLSAKVTVTRPAATAVAPPTDLRSTVRDEMTLLDWSQDEGSGATGFRVYRRTDPNGAWTLLGSTPTATFADRSAPTGRAYYYVAAVDDADADSVPSGQAAVDRLTPATATGPAQPQLTLVSSGSTRSPIVIGVKPGAGDEGRLLKGFSWSISGACGDAGLGRMTTTDTIEWTPPYSGPCEVSVIAVDVYGRSGERGSWLEFTVGR
ncbi:fibronectin type III domain-containing protein [Streptomyces broussonetiae]|uniref:PA14 domain-containing protein n=1 Tax=Streptomyces broussonetiae TaxID=2686304 RepID=A0ABV5EKI4_9ACTN